MRAYVSAPRCVSSLESAPTPTRSRRRRRRRGFSYRKKSAQKQSEFLFGIVEISSVTIFSVSVEKKIGPRCNLLSVVAASHELLVCDVDERKWRRQERQLMELRRRKKSVKPKTASRRKLGLEKKKQFCWEEVFGETSEEESFSKFERIGNFPDLSFPAKVTKILFW